MKPLSCIFNRHNDALVEVTAELLAQATKRFIYVNRGFKVTTQCLRCKRRHVAYKYQLTNEEESMLILNTIQNREMQIPRQ
ncbi:MAG: hypothetical protein WC365_08325 [Candidatus Babeliales bacterium]